jgi:predicted nucleic acid-binding Zn finger protein
VDTARIAHPAESPNTRAERALRLFEEHGSEIERIASEADVYFVPSEARTGSSCYRVDYENETCSCPDFAFGHGRACKHILAVGILNAKRRAKKAVCSGCGGKYPRKELIELHEDNHDNLTYFHGDHLCRLCANDAGVAY